MCHRSRPQPACIAVRSVPVRSPSVHEPMATTWAASSCASPAYCSTRHDDACLSRHALLSLFPRAHGWRPRTPVLRQGPSTHPARGAFVTMQVGDQHSRVRASACRPMADRRARLCELVRACTTETKSTGHRGRAAVPLTCGTCTEAWPRGYRRLEGSRRRHAEASASDNEEQIAAGLQDPAEQLWSRAAAYRCRTADSTGHVGEKLCQADRRELHHEAPAGSDTSSRSIWNKERQMPVRPAK